MASAKALHASGASVLDQGYGFGESLAGALTVSWPVRVGKPCLRAERPGEFDLAVGEVSPRRDSSATGRPRCVGVFAVSHKGTLNDEIYKHRHAVSWRIN